MLLVDLMIRDEAAPDPPPIGFGMVRIVVVLSRLLWFKFRFKLRLG